MNELIKAAKDLLSDLKGDYDALGESFAAETDLDKMNALDNQISQIGKDIVGLENKVLALEVAAKKSSFDPNELGSLASRMSEHRAETARVIKGHTESVEQAKYLASRVSTGAKLIGEVLRTIA
ncbi:MAG: hypothetical protein Q8T11_13720 [Elusimicrobiota bacterium]|nr:hypothetical protein [Elusimicrobiota bacterium]